MTLLPPGLADAQDPDYMAVRMRLSAGVEAGELTLGQARTMMIALEKHVAKTNELAFVRAFRERLRQAVEAGEMTQEEAREKFRDLMSGFDRSQGDRSQGDRSQGGEDIVKRLRDALEPGFDPGTDAAQVP